MTYIKLEAQLQVSDLGCHSPHLSISTQVHIPDIVAGNTLKILDISHLFSA